MSRVDSRYERRPRDLYETPAWVTEALIPHLPECRSIWEPACGNGAIVRVLTSRCYNVIATDEIDGENFFAYRSSHEVEGIVTNPPYRHAQEFVAHAISLMQGRNGFVAMLLSADFDSAKSRRHLFADCSIFSKKIVLLKRIVWFERQDGKRAAPSENHAWVLWSWRHQGPPTIAWAP